MLVYKQTVFDKRKIIFSLNEAISRIQKGTPAIDLNQRSKLVQICINL